MIADATYRQGAVSQAADLARDAINLARERTNRIAECHATLVNAKVLLGSKSGASASAGPLLARATQLVDVSGAAVFEPDLRDLRRLDTQIGEYRWACG